MNYPMNKESFYHFWRKFTSFLTLCFLIATLPAQAQQLLQKRVQLKQSDGSLLEIIQELEQHHGVTFSYDEGSLPKFRFKLTKKYWQLKELFKTIEGQVQVEFRYLNGQIILRKKKKAKVNFSGTIKVDGEQIPGATVYVPELNIGSATDANGYYSLLLPPRSLQFRIFVYWPSARKPGIGIGTRYLYGYQSLSYHRSAGRSSRKCATKCFN